MNKLAFAALLGLAGCASSSSFQAIPSDYALYPVDSRTLEKYSRPTVIYSAGKDGHVIKMPE